MAIVADLDTLKTMLGVTSDRDDPVLQQALDAASAHAVELVYPEAIALDPVAQGVLLHAARLYKRRQSPEGIAGWNDIGVVRIVATDPDIARLYERYVDMLRVGIA